MSLPSENEIWAVADKLGLLDEHGQVPRDKRTQLAAVAVAMRDVPDDGESAPLTTARALARFHAELTEHLLSSGMADAIVLAAVPALIARDGLIINEENRTP